VATARPRVSPQHADTRRRRSTCRRRRSPRPDATRVQERAPVDARIGLTHHGPVPRVNTARAFCGDCSSLPIEVADQQLDPVLGTPPGVGARAQLFQLPAVIGFPDPRMDVACLSVDRPHQPPVTPPRRERRQAIAFERLLMGCAPARRTGQRPVEIDEHLAEHRR
jgi:hypothetical protein